MTICIKFLLTRCGSVVGEGEELQHLLPSVCAGMTSEFKHAHREPLMCGGAGGPGAGWLRVELGNAVFICNIKPQLLKT